MSEISFVPSLDFWTYVGIGCEACMHICEEKLFSSKHMRFLTIVQEFLFDQVQSSMNA